MAKFLLQYNSDLWTFRYHLRIFQQVPHQILSKLNGKKHFLTLKGLWQINTRFWIWPWRSHNSDIQSQFSMSKIIWILPNFFSLKNIKSGAQLLLMTLFAYCHFWSTLFTKIGPKLQTLIPNQALICQRPFLVRKCLFPFN